MVQFYDPTQEAEIKRRRRMAEMLQMQGQSRPTEVVSGYAVPQSGFEGLARGLAGFAGGYEGAKADMMEQEQAKQRQQLADALMKAGTREEAAAIMAQDPSMVGEAMRMKFSSGEAMPSNVQEYNFYNQLSPAEKENYLRVKRSTPYLDIGGQLVQPSPLTGQPMSTFDKTRTPADEAKMKQNMMAEEARALSAIRENAQTSKKIAEILENKAGIAGITGLSSIVPNRPGSASANAQADIDTLKARSAFGALQEMRTNSPTGGALGGIAIQELEMLRNAEASLQNAQSEEEFTRALTDYKMALANADRVIKEAYRNKYGVDLPSETPVNDPLAAARDAMPPEGTMAENPTTGQRIIVRNGKWEQL
jgi:hypothetical protein